MLTAPATLEREFELDPHAYEMVIERVRRTSPFVVLDLPHVWTAWVKQTSSRPMTSCIVDDA